MKRLIAILLLLVMVAAIPATSLAAGYATVKVDALRVRNAPNFSGLSTWTGQILRRGTRVYWTSKNNTYTTVKIDGKTRYLWTAHLNFTTTSSSTKTNTNTTKTTTTTTSATKKANYYATTRTSDGSNVAFRSAPSSTASKLGAIAPGTRVYVYSTTADGYWSRIKYNNRTGYVRTSLLRRN